MADGVIVAKINDSFIQTDVSMFSDISVTVNQGSVLLTGNVELLIRKFRPRRSPGRPAVWLR